MSKGNMVSWMGRCPWLAPQLRVGGFPKIQKTPSHAEQVEVAFRPFDECFSGMHRGRERARGIPVSRPTGSRVGFDRVVGFASSCPRLICQSMSRRGRRVRTSFSWARRRTEVVRALIAVGASSRGLHHAQKEKKTEAGWNAACDGSSLQGMFVALAVAEDTQYPSSHWRVTGGE